jgi:hypothetical protein
MNPSNLTAPSYESNETVSTQQFFNNFYNKSYTISPNANDAIVSYFEGVADNKEAAQALAAAVIYTSLSQEVDPMSTLDQFTQLEPGEINVYLAMYLNLNRIPSSLLGITNKPITNKYVGRTILA